MVFLFFIQLNFIVFLVADFQLQGMGLSFEHANSIRIL